MKIELIKEQIYVEVKYDDGEFFRWEMKPAIIKFEGLFYWLLPEWSNINSTHLWIPCLKAGDKIVYNGDQAEVTSACNPWDEQNTSVVWYLKGDCRIKIDSQGFNDMMGFVEFIEKINGNNVYHTDYIDAAGAEELKTWLKSFVNPSPCTPFIGSQHINEQPELF